MKNKSLIIFLIISLMFVFNESYSFPFENLQKSVKKYQRKANRLVRNNKTIDAIGYYEKAYEINPEDSKLNLSLAFCYYNLQCYNKSLPYFEKVFQKNEITNSKLEYYLARNYHYTYQFDTAIYFYKNYIQKSIEIEVTEKNNIQKFISECENGIKLMQDTLNVVILSISSEINTGNQEYSPVYINDLETLIYTSRRENSIGGLKKFADNDFFEDIFISSMQLKNQNDSSLDLSGFNSRTNDATSGISGDGKTLFFFKDVNGGDIYFANILEDNTITKPSIYSHTINSMHFESCASTSSDNSVIYFISDRPDDNIGGKDIYFSTKDEKGNWNKPQNAGSKINTIEDEISVFVSPDGNKLYFSSKGHNTIGGYDVFVCEKIDSVWSEPKNIGIPLNSPSDDVFYSQYEQTAYFSTTNSDLPNRFDIFQAQIFEIEKEVKIDSTEAEILALKDRFGENYNLSLGKDNYLFQNSDFNLIEDSVLEVEEEIEEITPKAELKLYMNIEFEFGKTEISKISCNSLDTLAMVLKLNPEYKIVISGHTDNVGSFEVNQKISEERAQTVSMYLIDKGISKELIETKGYSYSKPISTNDSEEGRAKNRRVEFEFFKIED